MVLRKCSAMNDQKVYGLMSKKAFGFGFGFNTNIKKYMN